MTLEINITLDEMINSELITSIIKVEDQDLAEAGWTYEEAKAFGERMSNNDNK